MRTRDRSFAPEVILNVDANNDGVITDTGLNWMMVGHGTLGGDNFLSGDENPVTKGALDSGFVVMNALGGYSYWDANSAGTDFGTLAYSTFSTAVSLLPSDGISATSKVYSIDIVAGTSSNFDGLRVLVNNIELNGTTYTVPQPIAIVEIPPVTHGGQSGGQRHPYQLADGSWYCPSPLALSADPMNHCPGQHVGDSVGASTGAGSLQQQLLALLQQLLGLLQKLQSMR